MVVIFNLQNSHLLTLLLPTEEVSANNPEKFIESIVDTSWSQYLSSMAMQGTWPNHVIIQAVADALNLKIYIIESNQNFREMTLVEPSNVIQNPRLIYIGHIGEMHYVSTSHTSCNQLSNESDITETNNSSESLENYSKEKDSSSTDRSIDNITTENDVNMQNCSGNEFNCQKNIEIRSVSKKGKKRTVEQVDCGRSHGASKSTLEDKVQHNNYKRTYRANNASQENKAKRNEYQRNYRANNVCPEKRAKRNEYQRKYRANKASSEKRSKCNEYLKN